MHHQRHEKQAVGNTHPLRSRILRSSKLTIFDIKFILTSNKWYRNWKATKSISKKIPLNTRAYRITRIALNQSFNYSEVAIGLVTQSSSLHGTLTKQRNVICGIIELNLRANLSKFLDYT